MTNPLSGCSKPLNQIKKLNQILNCQNDVIRQQIEAHYPLSSLSEQDFILWCVNGAIYHGAFKRCELSGASKFKAYDFVDAEYITAFFQQQETNNPYESELPAIATGDYFMFVQVNSDSDLNSKDLDIMYALFIKSPIEVN
jgi:hypothetical protein